MNDGNRFKSIFKEMYKLCEKNNWGDPYSYARSREILMAIELNHKIADTYSGADGIDKNGKEVEYKSTIGKKLNVTYSGISKKSTWEKQLDYIKKEKIGKYHEHFYARFDGPIIVEIWKVDADSLVEHIIPKLKNVFFSKKIKADPRLCVNVNEKFIKSKGIKIK